MCYENQLKTLKGCAQKESGLLNCSNNDLIIEELKYLPKEITENFIILNENKELKEFEKITDFEKLKEKINPIIEKDKLLEIINKENLKKKSTIKKI